MSDTKFSHDAAMVPPCMTCKHLAVGTRTCAAFPRGIPPAIRAGMHDHRTRYPGDGGIMYERMEEVSDASE